MVRWSNSSLSAYEQCPLKFRFSYIDKEESDAVEGIEAFLGSRVHESLEHLYKSAKMSKLLSVNDVVSFYTDAWKKSWSDEVVILSKAFTAKNYFDHGKKMLEAYYARYHPFDENTIGTERHITMSLDKDGKYKMHGFIDRLVWNESEKRYEIHDYKTGKYLPTQEELDADRQLALYSLGVKKMYSDAHNVVLIWHYLNFDKEFSSKRTDEQLHKLKAETMKLIDTINKAKDYPPNVTKLCDWCEYRSICPKWSHLYKLKQKSVNEYLKDSGVKLVNTYATLKEKEFEFKGTVGREIEKVKEALIEYAKKNKVSAIFGSSSKASVNISERVKFPDKGSEEREALEKILKEARKWGDVDMLDTGALNEAMKTGEWPPELLRKIRRYAETAESASVRIGKMQEEEH